MRTHFTLKAGDTLAPLVVGLTNTDGSAVDLSDADEVTFVMRSAGAVGEPDVEAPADIITPPTDGRVQYAWQATDTATPGTYLASIVVTWPDGQQTYPTDDYLHIAIRPALAGDTEESDLPLTGWATAGDVLAITGQDIDGVSLAQAHMDVMAHADVTPADLVDDADLLRLRCATAYQAVWCAEQADLLSRSDVTSLGSGANSATLKVDSITLAPRARLFLSKLSWLGSQSVSIGLPVPRQDREARLWKRWY